MTTKSAILASYRAELSRYPWASDTAKLDNFMLAATNTLRQTPNRDDGLVDHHGHSWQRACELNGQFGKSQALKRLRALPEG